jgi:hypothetical protein
VQADAEAEKRMLLEKLTKPSGVSDEEALRRVAAIIERAVSNGLTEVQVYRLRSAPTTPCQSAAAGLGDALTGLPKEMYQFWERQLRPNGYKIKFQDRGFSRRHARRCRHQPETGVSG